MTFRGGFSLDGSLQTTTVTLPSEQHCHYITDTELDRIGDVSDNLPMQVFIGAVGAFAGSAVSSYGAIAHIGDPKNLFTGSDMTSISVSLVCLGLALFSGIEWRRLSRRQKTLFGEIKSRPKIPVTLVHDNTA